MVGLMSIINDLYGEPRLCGLTIKNGSGTELSGPTYGGGIYISGASPLLEELRVLNNQAYRGGGIYATNSDARIFRTIIKGNSAVDYGGGATFLSGCNPYLYEVLL